MIVVGGALGAVMLQFPLPVVLLAFRWLGAVFVTPKHDPQETIQRLMQYAQKARRDGIVSLDADLAEIEDPFVKKSLMLQSMAPNLRSYAKSWNWNSTIKPSIRNRFRRCLNLPAASRPPLALLGQFWG